MAEVMAQPVIGEELDPMDPFVARFDEDDDEDGWDTDDEDGWDDEEEDEFDDDDDWDDDWEEEEEEEEDSDDWNGADER